MSNLNVAQTILEQLGGHRFLSMTGARNLLGDSKSLQFRLPAGFSPQQVTNVRITVESDLYRLEFMYIRGTHKRVIADVDMVPVENLRMTFKMHTGLDCTL